MVNGSVRKIQAGRHGERNNDQEVGKHVRELVFRQCSGASGEMGRGTKSGRDGRRPVCAGG